jgi:hypothetical protein
MSASELSTDTTANHQTALAKLLCGNIIVNSVNDEGIDQVLVHLSKSIDNVVNELVNRDSLSPEQITLFVPFLGRSLLELGCTAIIARLDPFRVLMIREHQKQPDYKPDKRNKFSINWQSDVLSKKVDDLWGDKAPDIPTRSLFGAYYKDLVWLANFDKLLDAIDDVSGDEWIAELKMKGFLQFYNETLNGFSSLYSELSKGIHHELVIPLSSTFDPQTTQRLIEKTIRNIATLGLFVNVISHTFNKLDMPEAITTYKEIQEMGVF